MHPNAHISSAMEKLSSSKDNWDPKENTNFYKIIIILKLTHYSIKKG